MSAVSPTTEDLISYLEDALKPGSSTSEWKALIVGILTALAALAFAVINPRFGHHFVLTNTDRTVIAAGATLAAPTAASFYAHLRTKLKISAVAPILYSLPDHARASATLAPVFPYNTGTFQSSQTPTMSGTTMTAGPGIGVRVNESSPTEVGTPASTAPASTPAPQSTAIEGATSV